MGRSPSPPASHTRRREKNREREQRVRKRSRERDRDREHRDRSPDRDRERRHRSRDKSRERGDRSRRSRWIISCSVLGATLPYLTLLFSLFILNLICVERHSRSSPKPVKHNYLFTWYDSSVVLTMRHTPSHNFMCCRIHRKPLWWHFSIFVRKLLKQLSF